MLKTFWRATTRRCFATRETIDFVHVLPQQVAKQFNKLDVQDCWAEADELIKYKTLRKQALEYRKKLKKLRRFEIGPHASLCFENFDTIWIQVHEMITIEKGNKDAFADEIAAYSDLIPMGNNLIATFMIEIPNAQKRLLQLYAMGHVEDTFVMDMIANDGTVTSVKAKPISRERTTDEGKTSSVHFLSFECTDKQAFAQAKQVKIRIEHPNYKHEAALSAEQVQELAKDLKM